MCLTSNYNRKEWSTMSLIVLAKVVLPFCGVFFILLTFVLPMFDVMVDAIPILTDEEFVVEFRDILWDKGFNLNTILAYYVLTVAGGIVLPLLFMVFSMMKLLDFGSWMTQKLKVKDFELFWKGVSLKETRLGKKFAKL